jgi:cardiolipin synthase
MMLILIPLLLPKEIVIVGSYFLPGRRMNTALKKAENKVKIKLIPRHFRRYTLQTRNPSYLRYSLTITLSYMNGTKPFCMEKQQLLTAIGPLSVLFNLNNLSSYGSLEMNVEIKSTAFASSYLEHLNEVIAQCQTITHKSLKKK